MATEELVVNEGLVSEAYERVHGEMLALKPEELEVPTLDIHAAVKTVLGTLPELKALRERIVKELPAFDVAAFDKLEDYALALSRAQARFQIATAPPGALEQVGVEAAKVRERLVSTARSLVLFGLFDERKMEQLKYGNGFSNIAQDLQALSAAFEEVRPKLERNTPLTLDDVKAASRLALRLTRLVGLKEQNAQEQAAVTDLRRRAFTLMFRTYEDARAAVRFLRRREEDAESIAPTLFVKARRSKSDEDTELPEGSVPPPAPGSAPGAVPAAGAAGGVAASNGMPAPGSVGANGPYMP